MPFSSESGKAFIHAVVSDIAKNIAHSPLNVLDVGAGSGGYYEKFAAVLDPSRCRWYAIEAWKPYVDRYQLERKYYRVFNVDVRQYIRCLGFQTYPQKIDICFLGDVVEHMSKQDAMLVIQELFRVCKTIIISLPIVPWPQGEYEGNPFEVHVKDDWSHEEALSSFPHIKAWAVDNEIGVYVLEK